MKHLMTAAVAVALLLGAAPAFAGSADDANAGLDALTRGDYTKAVALFTNALNAGDLSQTDRAYALAQRSEAYSGLHRYDLAMNDATQALALNPNDADAQKAKARAQSGDGPPLTDTMAFIGQTVTNQGAVTWQGYVHDGAAGTDWNYQRTLSFSNFNPNVDSCILSYHQKTVNADGASEGDYGFDFHQVQTVKISTLEEFYATQDAKAGHPQYTSQMHPEVYTLLVIRGNGTWNEIEFYDQDQATRVAKAVMHAVDLCGGGQKSPF